MKTLPNEEYFKKYSTNFQSIIIRPLYRNFSSALTAAVPTADEPDEPNEEQ